MQGRFFHKTPAKQVIRNSQLLREHGADGSGVRRHHSSMGSPGHTQKVRVSTPSMNRWIKNKTNQKHLLHYIKPNNRKASDTFPIYAKNSSFFFDKMSFSNKSFSVCRRITFCPTCTSRFFFKTLQTDDVNLLAIEWNLRKN